MKLWRTLSFGGVFIAIAFVLVTGFSGGTVYAADNKVTADKCATYHAKQVSQTISGFTNLVYGDGSECVNSSEKWCELGNLVSSTLTPDPSSATVSGSYYNVYTLDCTKAKKKVEEEAKKKAEEQTKEAEEAASKKVVQTLCRDPSKTANLPNNLDTSDMEDVDIDAACQQRVNTAYGKCQSRYKDLIKKGDAGKVAMDQTVLDNRCTCLSEDPDMNALLSEKGKTGQDLGESCQASQETIKQLADNIGRTQCKGKTTDKDGNPYKWENGQCMTEVEAQKSDPTCNINKGHIIVGWIVCPFSNFLSTVADAFYGFITDNLLAIPSSNLFSNTTSLNAYRNFLPLANILLAIIFVLIIYSEATGNGFGALSNYSVKKLLPRLVVFAVLINISWYLCAAAVDLSNIIGVNIKGFFDDSLSFTGTTKYLNQSTALSGQAGMHIYGTATWVTLMAAILAGAVTIPGLSVMMLLSLVWPLLVVVIVVLIITWMILVIRQAGVVILCLISPLAFAMAAMPNGKKLFDKWLSAFMALWITWPVTALVLGVSTVAAKIMESTGDIKMIIAGMACRALPLIAIPFIVLGCLKAFGKAGDMVRQAASGAIRTNARWATNRSKEAAKTMKAGMQQRAMRTAQQNASKWANPEGHNWYQKKGGVKGIAANIGLKAMTASFDRQAKDDEAAKLIDNMLKTGYEKKIKDAKGFSGRQAAKVRASLDQATLANAVAKALSEVKKQQQITTNPEMAAMMNKKMAYGQAAKVYQNQQHTDYNKQVNDGAKILSKYELRDMTAIAQAEKAGALTVEQAANARLALTSAGAVPTTELLPSMQGDRNSPEN